MRSLVYCSAVAGFAAQKAASYCPLPSDATSPLYAMYQKNKMDMAQQMLGLPDAWLRCLGAIDVNAIAGTILASAYSQPTCLAALSFATVWSDTVQTEAKRLDSPTGSSSVALNDWPVVTNAAVQSTCVSIINALIPCLGAAIVPPLVDQVKTNPCCAGAVANVTTMLGMPLDTFVLKLLNYTTDIVCATQFPGFNGATNQTCGFSWFQAFTSTQPAGNAAQLVERLLTSLQIPNDQGCAAAQGNPFVTTAGVPIAQLFSKPIVPDACVKPVDNLWRWLRVIPSFATASWNNMRPLDALEDGKCVNVSDITLRDGVCVHLTNGGFDSCPFETAWSSAVFPGEGTKFAVASPTSTLKTSGIAGLVTFGMVFAAW
ncbi:hypothetical protein DYB37_004453 [Aphanomyces astaci]|uniref:Uncharacterized protein n=1 Tax=Aphanomyces astaci TaxID=112090 RepID=A0A3R7E672_APHAT|nr:hypothetical protein DYB35_003854 [Aphanomyces astaci]RHZ15229.1 hypothetical protein DYB37_004453 [Aphanomyces astaci]